ncbi:MAG: hypothetical protein PWP27_599 [Clostridiales bacterium]|jgi:tRNA G10  N-methylase Trm11|nr:hypothetical protein [Clostridiales bacterium]
MPNIGEELWSKHSLGKIKISDMTEPEKKAFFQYNIDAGIFDIDKFKSDVVKKYDLKPRGQSTPITQYNPNLYPHVDIPEPENVLPQVPSTPVISNEPATPSKSTFDVMLDRLKQAGNVVKNTAGNLPPTQTTGGRLLDSPVKDIRNSLDNLPTMPIFSDSDEANLKVLDEIKQTSTNEPVNAVINYNSGLGFNRSQLPTNIYDPKGNVDVNKVVNASSDEGINYNSSLGFSRNQIPDNATNMDYKEEGPGFFETTGKSILSGMAQANQAVGNVARMAYEGVSKLSDVITPDWLYDPQKDPTRKFLNKFVEDQGKAAEEINRELENLTGFKKFVSTGVSSLPQVALAGIGNVGLASKGASAVTRMLPFGAIAAGSYAKEAEEEGANYLQQLGYGVVGGMAEMATEIIPFERWLGMLKRAGAGELIDRGAKTLLDRYGKVGGEYLTNVLLEGAQEGIIGPITNAVKKATYKQDMPLAGEGGVIDPRQIAEDFYGGVAMGTILGALGLPASTLSHKMAAEKIESGNAITPDDVEAIRRQVNKDTDTGFDNISKIVTELNRTSRENSIRMDREAANDPNNIFGNLNREAVRRSPEGQNIKVNVNRPETEKKSTTIENNKSNDTFKTVYNGLIKKYGKPANDNEKSFYESKARETIAIRDGVRSGTLTEEDADNFIKRLETEFNNLKESKAKPIEPTHTPQIELQAKENKKIGTIQANEEKIATDENEQPKTDISIKKEEPSEIKLGRAGNSTLKKWANNEYVMADIETDNEYGNKFKQFFKKWYDAGYKNIRTIDVVQNELDVGFPPFLQQEAYNAGQKDREAKDKKEAKKEIVTTVTETEPKEESHSKTLSDYGLEVKKASTNKGNTVYHVLGDTKRYLDIFREFKAQKKAQWYKPHKKAKGVWSFKEDPTDELLEAIKEFEGENTKVETKEDVKKDTTSSKLENNKVKDKKETPIYETLKDDLFDIITSKEKIINTVKNNDEQTAKISIEKSINDAILDNLFPKHGGLEELGKLNKETDIINKIFSLKENRSFINEIYNKVFWDNKLNEKESGEDERQSTSEADSREVKEESAKEPEIKKEEVENDTTFSEAENNNIEESNKEKDNKEQTKIQKAADEIKKYIKNGETLKSNDLYKIVSNVYKSSQASGDFSVKDAYDILELAVNQYLLEQNDINLISSNKKTIIDNLEKLNELLLKLPTQRNRTEEQIQFQQFSTPPTIAYIANWLANVNENDTMLEPSAGIGGIALFSKLNGATVIVNELSKRRFEILKHMPFDKFYNEDAEQINNILPKEIKPTVVVMNPPFSSAGHRIKTKKNTNKIAAKHIEQALKRLEEGGRLVAIVGRGMSDTAPSFKDWWKDIKSKYNVRANIGINGKNYTKYGTSFDIQILVIDKTGKTETPTLTGNVENLSEIFNMLGEIRNDRVRIQENKGTQQTSDQSKSIGGVKESKTTDSGRSNLPNSINAMGSGESESTTNNRRDKGTISDSGQSTRDSSKSASNQTIGSDKDSNISEGNRSTKSNTNNGEYTRKNNRDTRRSSDNDIEIEVQNEKRKSNKKQLTDSVYAEYKPQKLKIKGAKPHPGKLSQSAAMEAVEPPKPTYKPNLPSEVIEKGLLSLAQLESVVYAGQSHEHILPNGTRRGFFIGDGTGVGKGRQISGIILDNFRKGRKKAIWISKNAPLFPDAQRDWSSLGNDPKDVFDLSKVKKGTSIDRKEGILFTTYDTLRNGLEFNRDGMLLGDIKNTRIGQIVEWVGKDFDGVIAFDEAHNMGNSLPIDSGRGRKKPAAKALAGIELQRLLPNARVVYVSATGATEVENLAYAERLGLWGEGTAFPDKHNFVSKIADGGLAAMELVARDMKALGVYLARSLSYDGINYSTIEHKLTKKQKEQYNLISRAWQVVLQNINEALKITEQEGNGNAKGNVMGAFWSAQQRFFNQVLTSMQMPSVIEDVKKELEKGNAVVMQLVNTNAASQDRQIAKIMEEEGSLDDIDLTPKDTLLQMIEKSFPTKQYVEEEDENGNIRYVPVVDSEGNFVENREAVEMRDQLLEEMSNLRIPDGPLEMVINSFGVKNVAEVTGRQRRVIEIQDERTGKTKKILESRSKAKVAADVSAFMNDKKRILIFSDAGGTGKSYHADNTAKNKRHRIHYLIQAGWRADNAVQGFGRTHRTNQASAPTYKLVTTDLKGQKRFISSIARRLDQLGALTKGQRQTGSQGMFSASDNLESPLSRDALTIFYRNLGKNKIPGLDAKEILTMMGLKDKFYDKYDNFQLNEEVAKDVPKFLNRILALDYEYQNKVFDAFADTLEQITELAIQRGELDTGLENSKADKAEIINEIVVRVDEVTGVETKYVNVKEYYKLTSVKFEDIDTSNKAFMGFYRNSRSENVRAAFNLGTRTLPSGEIVDKIRLVGETENKNTIVYGDKFENSNWEKISNEEAKTLWDEQLKKADKYRIENLHLITGSLLPIWDRLPNGKARVVRILTDDGNVLLGRLIPEREVDYTLKKLGAERKKGEVDYKKLVKQILDDNYSVRLSNGWKLARRKVSGEYRIEITGDELYQNREQLKKHGVFTERIASNTRYFIPVGETGAKTIEAITKYRPITDINIPESQSEVGSQFEGKPDTSLGVVAEAFRGSIKNPSEYTGFLDEEVEKRYSGSKGLKKKTFIDTVKEKAVELGEMSVRTFRYLPENEFFAEAHKELVQYPKIKGIASDEIVRVLEEVTRNLDQDSFDIFSRVVFLRDLQEEASIGNKLPQGFTTEMVELELERIEPFITPLIEQALKIRDKHWNNIKKRYINAMKKLGFNVEKRLTRENYFRHQVIEMMDRKKITSSGSRVKINTGRGYLKNRHGTELDINTDYLQVEYEPMVQMLIDTEIAEMLGRIEDNYSIKNMLEKQADKLNEEYIEGIIIKELEDENAPTDELGQPISETEEILKEFKKKIAIAISNLEKLAISGELDEHIEFKSVINDLKKKALEKEGLDILDEFIDLDSSNTNNPKFFKFLAYLAKQDDNTPGKIDALSIFKQISQRREFKKQILGNHYQTWDKLIPEGYDRWQPREGTAFYVTKAIPEEIAAKLAEQSLSDLGLSPEKLQEVLVKGGRYKEFVLPVELINTLNEVYKNKTDTALNWLLERPLNLWKRWILTLNPRKFFKYNIRNLSGDLDAVLGGGVGALKYVNRALKEVYDAMHYGRFTKDMKEWRDRGGYQSLLIAQEITDINTLSDFERLYKGNVKKNIIKKGLKWYTNKTQFLTDYREAILRYSAYLYFKDHINKNNGKVKNYGASKRALVDGLKTVQDKAYKLSKDLLGAYDEITEVGQIMRRYLIPFYSWNEVNFKRYINLYRNALSDVKVTKEVGRGILKTLGITASVTTKTAINIGIITLKVSALTGILALINSQFPDDEDELPETVRTRPHLLLPLLEFDEDGNLVGMSVKDKDGNIRYFSRLGALNDFLEWFGLEEVPSDVIKFLNGDIDFKEVLINAITKDDEIKPANKVAWAIGNKLYAGLTPYIKTPFEAIAGITGYPDLENMRKVRDKGEYIAQTLGLEEEYKAIVGKPKRKPYFENLDKMFIYKADPKESAYYEMLDKKRQFEKSQGKTPSTILNDNPRSKALYNFKLALKYKDKKAAYKYLEAYFENGGTGRGITQSLSTMSPLYGLSIKDGEYAEFRFKFLNDKEREKLKIALEHYNDIAYLPKAYKTVLNSSKVPEFLKKKFLEKYIDMKMKE